MKIDLEKNQKMDKKFVHKGFVFLALIFGMMFIMLIPPFQAPDEDSHFKKAYVLAEGNFFPDVVEGKKGYYLPEGMVEYIQEQTKSIGDLSYKFSYSDIANAEKNSGDYSDSIFVQFSTMSTNFVGHIVPAAGIVFGKMIASLSGRIPSYIFLLYFARFFSLLAYIVIVASAIKITPILKNTFCILALMPMSLYLASAVSYDMLLIGGSFLFTAMSFSILCNAEKKYDISYLIIFGVIAYIFYVLKLIYLPMFLILFVIVMGKYSRGEDSIKKYVRAAIVSIGVFLILIIITKTLPGLLAETTQVVSTSGPSLEQQQKELIISDPLKYLQIFFTELKTRRDFYVTSTVGTLGLVDTPLFSVYVYPYVFAVLITGISEISLSEIKVKWWHRLAVILPIAAAVFGAFLAMYISWTPLIYGVGAEVIEGVQGRYFLPLLPPLFLIFANSIVRRKKYLNYVAERALDYSVCIPIIMLLITVLTLLLRYWI